MSIKHKLRTRTLQTLTTEDDVIAFMLEDVNYNYNTQPSDIVFFLDPEATEYMMNNSDIFTAYEDLRTPIKLLSTIYSLYVIIIQ